MVDLISAAFAIKSMPLFVRYLAFPGLIKNELKIIIRNVRWRAFRGRHGFYTLIIFLNNILVSKLVNRATRYMPACTNCSGWHTVCCPVRGPWQISCLNVNVYLFEEGSAIVSILNLYSLKCFLDFVLPLHAAVAYKLYTPQLFVFHFP